MTLTQSTEPSPPRSVELGPFLAAIIDVQGGEVRIPYSVFIEQTGEKAITIDIEDDGATLVLSMVDVKDIPDDAE